MKLGVYTAVLHDKPLPEALRVIKGLGLESAEINSGGFVPRAAPAAATCWPARPPGRSTSASSRRPGSRDGAELQRQPARPEPGPRPKALRRHPAVHRGRRRARREAGGHHVRHAGHRGGRDQARLERLPWDSAYLDVRDYQWNEVAIPFWRTSRSAAAHFDVKVALEMHPGNVVYNPADAGAAGDRDRGDPHRRRAGPQPPVLAGHRTRRGGRPPRVRWSSTPPPRTPGSTRPPGSTACSTTSASPVRSRARPG